MFDDLGFALELCEGPADDSKPHLVEVCRRYSHGRPGARVFLWSTGRIGALVAETQVCLKRHRGKIGAVSGLRLSFKQLRALHSIVGHWSEHRDQWAAWAFRFNGVSASYYYQPPGISSEEEFLGGGGLGGFRKGQTEFLGREEFRPIRPPVLLDDDVSVRDLIWRSGERQGPPGGLQVGLGYEAAGNLRARAYRDRLCVQGEGDVVIEPHSEVAFIQELIGIAASTS